MYFGWNLGLPVAGPFAFAGATLLVTVLYVCFVLSYAELACALPRAGGAFVYAERAFGPPLAFLTGLAQAIEFAFAPPAIAAAIGAHVHLLFPAVPVLGAAFAVYVVFTALNAHGVAQSAAFELLVTALAVAGLLLFAALALPRFTWAAFAYDPVARGGGGAWAAVPYAIWFYLAIEGVANVAEETANPQRDLPRGFGSAMATLVALTLLTLVAAVGVAGWPTVVYPPGSSAPSDSPLPLALAPVVGTSHALYRSVVVVGVCGLVASFHGILLAAGRALFELGRMGYAPAALGRLLPSRRTPAVALVVNMVVGMIALLTRRTGQLITISVLGALVMYALAMAALFALRRRDPDLPRPFRVPLYPWTPAIALALSLLCLVAVAYSALRA
jgi:ethanolamine permease